MTRAEADAKAKELWGPYAGAQAVHRPGKPNVYAIGVTTHTNKAFTFGRGESFEAAFKMAEDNGITREKVAAVFAKHEGRLKRKIALAAFLNLFRSV